MSGKKRIASFLLGICLIGLGALFFLAPERSNAMQLLMRYWPIFLILAGLVRATGYLIDRHPKSPVGGVLTAALGGILLSANLRGEQSFLQILGAYWFWILLALIIGRIIKQYLHRSQDGIRPRAFSPAAVFLMILIVGAGLSANLIVKRGVPINGFNFQIGAFKNSYLIEDDLEQSFSLSAGPGSRIIIEGIPGDAVLTVSSRSQAGARLIKRIKAQTQEAAEQIAEKIDLQITSDKKISRLNVASEGPSNPDLQVTLLVEIPKSSLASIEAVNVDGIVKISGLSGDHTIRNSGQVEIKDNEGGITIENARDTSGAIDLSRIKGPVTLVGSQAKAQLKEIAGDISIRSHNGTVVAEEIEGEVTVESEREVTLRNFKGPVSISTRSGPINLSSSEPIEAELKASTDNGSIRLNLPEDAEFGIDAASTNGRVRIRGFDRTEYKVNERSLILGYNVADSGPLLTLRTRSGNIELRSSGMAIARRETADGVR